jgi:hypothetical protein
VLITDIPCVDGLGAKEPSRKGRATTEPVGYKEERLVRVWFMQQFITHLSCYVVFQFPLRFVACVVALCMFGLLSFLLCMHASRFGSIEARPMPLLLLLQDAELGGKGSVSGHHGYTAVDDDLLDPWADARSQLRSGNAEVGSNAASLGGYDILAGTATAVAAAYSVNQLVSDS